MNFNRAREITRAQEYFDNVINEDLVRYESTLLALTKKIEILLIEYKLTQNNEVLDEINQLFERIENLHKNNNLPKITLQYFILRSKFEFVQGNIERAIDLIESIRSKISEETNPYITQQISEAVKLYTDEIEKMNAIIQSSDSVVKKMEETKILEYIDQISDIIYYRSD